jgi:cysteinyl-tRNA synthetase
MELTLYDTMTRKKRPFVPRDPARVRMYVCGPTVYDFAHIGNARPVIVFDVLFRLLRRRYGADHVVYVRNITDVDDKINERAAEEYSNLPLNEAIRTVTQKTERQFHEDVAALGCLPPTVEPRATEHIEAMKTLIERLVAEGHAYVAKDHVLFSVHSMPDYGSLCKQPLDEMIAGARVEVALFKHDPMDFVLWKPSKPGEPAWPSPAGIVAPGRPGWHIECSAMAWQYLGETFDIHGGGIDLIFPHHENEIAQSRCAFHTPVMANYWMHNNFLQVEGRKMAKSEGNFVTIRDLLEEGGGKWRGAILRYNMLRKHYREPLNWTESGLAQSSNELHDLEYTALEFLASEPDVRFLALLADDLNTPLARARLFELRDEARRGNDEAGRRLRGSLEFYGFQLGTPEVAVVPGFGFRTSREAALYEILAIFPGEAFIGEVQRAFKAKMDSGTLHADELPPGFLDLLNSISSEMRVRELRTISEKRLDLIIRLRDQRNTARKTGRFGEADRVRNDLKEMGVELDDQKDGTTTWKVK